MDSAEGTTFVGPTREWPVPVGYVAHNEDRCRSCQADVLWCTVVASGRKAPLNPDGTSHFSSCPQAGQWRRR